MTLSIAARDEATGQLGAIISSSSISVSSRCLHWRSGIGIALSQNITDPRLGPRILALLADGVEARDAISAVVQSTPYIGYRQLGLIDIHGNTAGYTGDRVLGCFASAEGRQCVAAGNLLANESVPAAMVASFESSSGSFGTRLLAALGAGVEAGGEAGPLHSAGMLIGGEASWPRAELRIDWDENPLERMQAGWEVYEPQVDDYVTRAFNPEAAPSYGRTWRSVMNRSMMNSEDMLAKLIAFDTTSTTSNLDLIDFVRNLLDDCGVASQLIHNEDQTRANLYASIGPDDIGGIMLSGHTDVVPTTGQDWNSDPYSMRVDDELLTGRGACDMKGFIACVMSALPRITEAPLQTPVHLAFSYDEEIGCVGARRLVEAMSGFEVKPRFGLIGEPTDMAMVLGHKGKVSYRVTVTGLSCHSAYISDGVNAVEYAAELIAFIRAMNQRVQQQQTDDSYSVPYSTFHVGNINGGTALNIVPRQCQFEFEIRNLPQQDIDTLVHDIRHYANDVLLADMRQRYPEAEIEFTELSYYPGLHTDPASTVIAYTRAINPINRIGDKVSFGTEAGLFDKIGIDCLVCGPGSIAQAHKPDEFVSREQLRYCDQMIENLVLRCREVPEFA